MMFQKVDRSSKTEAFGLEYIGALYGYVLMLAHIRVEAKATSTHWGRGIGSTKKATSKTGFVPFFGMCGLNQLRKRRSELHLVEMDGPERGVDYLPLEIHATRMKSRRRGRWRTDPRSRSANS